MKFHTCDLSLELANLQTKKSTKLKTSERASG